MVHQMAIECLTKHASLGNTCHLYQQYIFYLTFGACTCTNLNLITEDLLQTLNLHCNYIMPLASTVDMN